MAREESHFFLHGCLHRYLILNVLLRTILDADEAETQLDLLIHDSALGIGTTVHDIDLGNDTYSSDALRIDTACHTETFLSGHISIGRDDAKNDRARVANVPLRHAASDLLDVLRLAWDGNQSDAWQVDQRQVRTGMRVHVQYNWIVDDVSRRTSDLVSEGNDCVTHFLEVGELLAFHLL